MTLKEETKKGIIQKKKENKWTGKGVGGEGGQIAREAGVLRRERKGRSFKEVRPGGTRQ